MTISNDMLQQYFDGELDESSAKRVREEVERSPTARAQLDSLETLRTLMRSAAASSSANVESEDLFVRIGKGIAERKASGMGEAFDVIEGEGGPAPRSRAWPWVLVAAAAAAVITFVARPTHNGAPAPIVTTTIEQKPVPPAGTEVLEVDFGGNTGTVFALEGDAGEPIAVVWINDDEEAL